MENTRKFWIEHRRQGDKLAAEAEVRLLEFYGKNGEAAHEAHRKAMECLKTVVDTAASLDPAAAGIMAIVVLLGSLKTDRQIFDWIENEQIPEPEGWDRR